MNAPAAQTRSVTSSRRLPGEFLKAILISGVLVILPFGLAAMILLKVVEMIRPLAAALASWMPHGLRFPTLIASLILLLVCLAVGLLAQTRAGRGAGASLESVILNRIPGYSMVRSLTRRIGNVEESEEFSPALVEIEDALVPGFVVEEHTDGRYTVFIPSAPTPAVGTVYIIARERVHILDASFIKTVKCVSSWGVGSKELLRAMRPALESVKH
jgi:uncharacterized membrane protein